MASCDRREFLSSVAAGVAASAVAGGAAADAQQGAKAAPAAPAGGLAPLAFTPLPARRHPTDRLAAAPAAHPGRRPDGPPRRVLAGRRPEPVVRRHGRGLGARALLARRRHPARLDPGRRAAEGPHHPLRRLHRHPPARGRLVQPVSRGRGHEALRHVGHPAGQQGARPVPRGHRRRTRARRRGEEPEGHPRRPRPHAALRLGQVPLVRGPRLGLLRVRADGRDLAARPGPEAARPGLRLRGALQDRGHPAPDAAPRPLEMDQARRQHRHGRQGRRP